MAQMQAQADASAGSQQTPEVQGEFAAGDMDMSGDAPVGMPGGGAPGAGAGAPGGASTMPS